MNDEKRPEGEIKLNTPFMKKIDNFFYHYKWHSIVAVFLVIVLLVCLFQTCGKQKYDVEIMYAGPYSLRSDLQGQIDIQSAFSKVTEDKNGDKVGKANIVPIWIDETTTEGGDALFIQTYQTNLKLYTDEIQAGNISICLLSPSLFYMVHEQGGFMRIDELAPDLPEEVYHVGKSGSVNHYAVRLSKTDFGKENLSFLPEDTILCIRKPAYNIFNSRRVKKQHAAALETFLAALNYTQAEGE